MTETSGTPHQNESLLWQDYDVLGVGGARRRRLRAEANVRAGELICHPEFVPSSRRALYEELKRETVAWLKPAKTVDAPSQSSSASTRLFALLFHELKRGFPETCQRLGAEAETYLRLYLEEFPWQGPLLVDHFRYFNVFLKSLGPGAKLDADVSAVAQFEWLRSYLSFTDFGSARKESGRLTLNPSLQPVRLVSELRIACEAPRPRGLYLLYQEPETLEVREYTLDADEAAILDLLEEEAKFSVSKVLQILGQDTVDGRKRLSNLCSLGIIEADSKVLPEELV